MMIEFLYFDDCPNWRTAHERLEAILAGADDPPTIRMVTVTSPDDARRLAFRGSPTILVDGQDVFASGDEPVGLSCRIYQTPDGPQGSPTTEQLRAALGA